ncbi:hypothetical protein CYMTET_23838, partial [Cymbomonas tetramitiformis]
AVTILQAKEKKSNRRSIIKVNIKSRKTGKSGKSTRRNSGASSTRTSGGVSRRASVGDALAIDDEEQKDEHS